VALLPLAALGVAALARRPHGRRLLFALLLLMGAVVAHAVAYRIPDKEPYYLPAYLVVALLIAAGVDFTLGLLARRGRAERRLAGFALLAAVLVPLMVHLPAADRHADRSLRDLTREVLRRTTPGSLIVSDDTSLYFASLYLKASEGVFSDREPVASYLLPLAWYAESVGRLDAAVPAEAAAQQGRRRGLAGRALGDRLAADARALVAGVARRGLGRRDVFLYFHSFDEERKSFEGLRLEDRGLVYQVVSGDTVAPSTGDPVTAPDTAAAQAPITIPDATFERLDAYTADRHLTFEERSVARRFAVAANRAGIARVRRGDLADAEAEFKKALALSPDYAQAWLNLGLLYADFLRLPEEAVRAWGTYLELAESEPEAAPVRARLTRLTRVQTESESAAPLDSAGPEP
jgi:tetratricopeptide (TPR) repeat protein